MNWIKEFGSLAVNFNHVLYFDQLKQHYLKVGESIDSNSFHVKYCIDGNIQISKTIVAKDLETAQSIAIQLVKEYVNDNIHYWNAINHQIRCVI